MTAGHSMDPARWQEAFEVVTDRIASRFTRVDPACRPGGGLPTTRELAYYRRYSPLRCR